MLRRGRVQHVRLEHRVVVEAAERHAVAREDVRGELQVPAGLRRVARRASRAGARARRRDRAGPARPDSGAPAGCRPLRPGSRRARCRRARPACSARLVVAISSAASGAAATLSSQRLEVCVRDDRLVASFDPRAPARSARRPRVPRSAPPLDAPRLAAPGSPRSRRSNRPNSSRSNNRGEPFDVRARSARDPSMCSGSSTSQRMVASSFDRSSVSSAARSRSPILPGHLRRVRLERRRRRGTAAAISRRSSARRPRCPGCCRSGRRSARGSPRSARASRRISPARPRGRASCCPSC